MPPYLRLVVPSACWNASKMMRCLSSGMPMPVSSTEKAITDSALLEDRVVRLPSLVARLHRERHRAVLGELERVREQVLDDLLQPLEVGGHGARQVAPPGRP